MSVTTVYWRKPERLIETLPCLRSVCKTGRGCAGPACVRQLSGRALEADGPGHEPRRRDELRFDAVLGADAAQDDVFQRAWQAAAGTRFRVRLAQAAAEPALFAPVRLLRRSARSARVSVQR